MDEAYDWLQSLPDLLGDMILNVVAGLLFVAVWFGVRGIRRLWRKLY
jgi:hypothetical protein